MGNGVIKYLSYIYAFKIRQIRNYLFRRIDRVTRIEMLLFLIFLAVFFIDSLSVKITRLAARGGLQQSEYFYFAFSNVCLVATFITAFIACRQHMRQEKTLFLLSQPVPFRIISIVKVLKSISTSILFLFLLLIMNTLFAVRLSFGYLVAVGLVLQLLNYAAAAILAIGSALVINRGIVKSKTDQILFITLSAITFYLFLFQWKALSWQHIFLRILISAVVAGLALFRILHLLDRNLARDPFAFIRQKKQRIRLRTDSPLWRIFLLPVPKKLHAFLIKDFLCVLRRNKGYIIVYVLGIAAITAAALATPDEIGAIQWVFSIILLTGYVVANNAFYFHHDDVELMAVIKMQPVLARDYWWGKFWVSFLPIAWFTVLGHILVLVKSVSHTGYWAGSLLLSFLINFTLFFIQTNFSLYSYPYARYAALWYNLYLFTAITFFTVFLFPPLTIAFLIFGFLAIIKVQRRIQELEIIQ